MNVLGVSAQFHDAAAALVVWGAPTTQELLRREGRRTLVAVAAQALFVWALLHLHHTDHVPFLYFQF